MVAGSCWILDMLKRFLFDRTPEVAGGDQRS